MKNTQLIIGSLLLICCSSVFAQGGKNVKPISPELLAKAVKADEALAAGEVFLTQNKFDGAIRSFQKVVSIENTMPGRTSVGNYALGRALTAAGRIEDALVAYKRAVWWNPNRKDLEVNGPPLVPFAMDYAILLAKSGHSEEAKSLYYFGLRNLNPNQESWIEPIPFAVVFDSEPGATVWAYTPQKLIAAATMAKAPFMGRKTEAAISEVRQMEPNWVVPIAYLASMRLGPSREELLNTAEKLAKSSTEKNQVRALRMGEVLEPVGVKLRKGSKTLNKSKESLASSYSSVASK